MHLVSSAFIGREVRLDELVHARLELGDSQRLLQIVSRSRVATHRLVVLDRSPLCVHRDLGAVEASMKGGGHEAGRMAHRRNGRVREQVHEPLLIRGLNCEDVNEGD